MASLRPEGLKITYKLYVFSFILVGMLLTGCGSEPLLMNDDSKHELQYIQNAKNVSIVEQQVLLKMIDQISKQDQAFLSIDVPSPVTQAESYDRALWQSRANQLQQFLRMQGLSYNQIQMRECSLCSSIRVG